MPQGGKDMNLDEKKVLVVDLNKKRVCLKMFERILKVQIIINL